jgi:hypothetical protein
VSDPNDEEEWERWRTWLVNDGTRDTIYAQVVEMLMFRQIWDGFTYVYDNAPEAAREDATFLSWIRFSYARSQGLGVRRMADLRRDVVSLARLIDHVWRYPTVLSRERFIALQGEPDAFRQPDSWFDGLAGTGDYIDPRIPAQDFSDLQTKTATVRQWVNTTVAHLTEKGRPREGPPLRAVHDSVDVVADLFEKYHKLIRGGALHSGVIMQPWPTVFRVPWIANDAQFRAAVAKLHEAELRRGERPNTSD